LRAALDEAVTIIKNRNVTAGPLSGKKYAELFAIVNAVTPALSRHGLSSSWKITKDDKEWIEVTCTLKHTGGHTESVSMGGPPDVGGAKNAIQARASTVSYLERYTLKAITGLSRARGRRRRRGRLMAAGDYALTVPQIKQAAELYLDGNSRREVARFFDVSEEAVKSALRLEGVRMRPRSEAATLAMQKWKRSRKRTSSVFQQAA
jgi:hypothetical protein